MDDSQIVNRVLNGEIELFSAIVERYHLKVYSLCMGFVHHQEDAEDITQDIFASVYTSLVSFKGNSQFSTWLYRIAVNTTYSFLRQKRRRETVLFFGMFNVAEKEHIHSMLQSDEPDHILNKKQTQKYIYKEIDSLPDNQRKAFILSKYDDLPQREIAAIMEISEEAVESLLQRAKRNLQKKLKKFYDFEFKATEFIPPSY